MEKGLKIDHDYRDLSLMNVARKVVNLVENKIKKRKMFLWGQSFGSMVSAIISHFYPERVIGLALIGSGTLSPTFGMRQYIAFGYGTLAETFTDEEVIKKASDPEFREWYHKVAQENAG